MSAPDTSHRINGTLLNLYLEVPANTAMLKDAVERIEAVEEKVDASKQDLARYRGSLGASCGSARSCGAPSRCSRTGGGESGGNLPQMAANCCSAT